MGNGSSQERESSQTQTQPNAVHHNKITENPTQVAKQSPNNNNNNKPVVCKASELNNGGTKNSDDNTRESAKRVKLDAIHNFQHILGVEHRSSEELLTCLQQGILLNQKRQKYWVDKDGKNCFVIYARDLSITWGDDKRYWKWHQLGDESGESSVEVITLVNVCWLEICGKFDTRKLSPGTLYEVSFIVMIEQQSYGWDVPVNITLNLPDGGRIAHKVNMARQPKGQWVDITVGTFRKSSENHDGDIMFSVHEYDGGEWKRGLVIKGVKIQPKMV